MWRGTGRSQPSIRSQIDGRDQPRARLPEGPGLSAALGRGWLTSGAQLLGRVPERPNLHRTARIGSGLIKVRQSDLRWLLKIWWRARACLLGCQRWRRPTPRRCFRVTRQTWPWARHRRIGTRGYRSMEEWPDGGASLLRWAIARATRPRMGNQGHGEVGYLERRLWSTWAMARTQRAPSQRRRRHDCMTRSSVSASKEE
jgi:hypothetical protein